MFPFRPPPHPNGTEHAPVVIVGAGVVGLTLALDLARRGVATIVLDEDDTVASGSRAICWAKRSLEIYARLGIGGRMLARGVTWNRGRVFHREREAYAFDLLPEEGHEFPAFVNLQQYHVEAWLVEACLATGRVDLRWKHAVARSAPHAAGVTVAVTTQAGDYTLEAAWLLACDGARSTIREGMGLPFTGRVFRDRFLIADVRMDLPFPAERRFWFDPPFHPGQTVLLHKQADGQWRVDFQLGWDADPEAERDPARLRARLARMVGEHVAVEILWVSVYTFRCRRLQRFRHGRVLFAGDSAHQVSPFGARGGNSGVQDADNLGWKLAAIVQGTAPDALLDSYDAERVLAADENILHSTRSTDFLTPKDAAGAAYRDAVLELAGDHAFARPLVNSGRLSRPSVLHGSQLSTAPDGHGSLPLGAPAPDAPVRDEGRPGWFLRRLAAEPGFVLVRERDGPRPPDSIAALTLGDDALEDHSGLAAARLGLRPGEALLFRPDQHLCARFPPGTQAAAILAARDRALARLAP